MPHAVCHSASESIAEIPEPELVRRLLADPHWRERFLCIHGIPDEPRALSEVPLTGTRGEGDIDILAVDPSTPEEATAIQVKRIKVSQRTFETGLPNGFPAIKHLQRQSSLLVRLGFWQVFSYAIVVVDSRANNQGVYAFDGLTADLRSRIESALSMEGLHANVGFIQFELCQPIDHEPLSTGTFFAHIRRMPRTQPQPEAITAWVRARLANSGTL